MDTNTQNLVQNAPEQKKSPLVVILLAVLLLGSLGFAGFELWQGLQKDKTIDDLEKENKSLSARVETATTEKKENFIVKDIAPKQYSLSFSSSKLMPSDHIFHGQDIVLDIFVNNGKISACRIHGDRGDGQYSSMDCTISGLSGNIYKIVEVGAGHDQTNNQVAFIMEDGTVEYFALPSADTENTELTIEGKMEIDGFVTDALTAGVSEEGYHGGYNATLFVLADGSVVEYSESLLK